MKISLLALVLLCAAPAVAAPTVAGVREDYNRLSQNGNLPNNLLDLYSGAIFTRYYSSGADPKYGGMDWRALFLAWRPVGRKWVLVDVANDEWTT